MTDWTYYGPDGWTGKRSLAVEIGVVPETVGPSQLALMLRARASATGVLVLTHERSSNKERMAARRLVERELLRQSFSRPMRNYRGRTVARNTSGIYVYTLTRRGWECWLRVRDEGQ